MDNKVKRTERGDKIKLEDMTLAQIKELKEYIIDEIHFAINKATSGYDVGEVCLYANVDYVSDDTRRIRYPKQHIKIKFSKEDD